MLKVAIAQIQSTERLEYNLAQMKSFVKQAHSKGAGIIAFPEMAYLTGKPEVWRSVVGSFRELLKQFSGWAKQYAICLIPGSLREPIAGVKDRIYNTLPVFNSEGRLVAVYRKIFLFKAKLPDKDYDETSYCNPGDRPMVGNAGGIRIGVSICYDLRFPELYRALKKKRAQIAMVPSAFTVPTGRAHWHVLLRARAIENQFFVVAPGQMGRSGDGSEKFGHSLIVSPWGEVLLDMENEEGVGICNLDLSAITKAQSKVDAWASRREDVFPSKR